MAFDLTGRPRRELQPQRVRRFDASQIARGMGVGNVTRDTDGLIKSIAAVAGRGGGQLYIPDSLILGDDIDCPRTVTLVGLDPSVTILKSDGTQRRINITGQPGQSPGFDGDLYAARFLTFDNVSLVLGPGVSDHARGCVAFFCQFVNSDYGLYVEGENSTAFAQVGAMMCKFRLCDYGIIFHRGGPHHIVSQCDVSECAEAAILVDGMQPDGISLFIANGYSDHCRRFLKVVGPITDGGIYVARWGVELCGTLPGDVPAADGYAIEMEGGQVWLEQFQMFNGPHTSSQFYVKGGVLFDTGGGRRYWDDGEYARTEGAGVIVVDQSKIFSPGRLWGNGQAPFAHASSSGGKIVAPRSGYIGWVGGSSAVLNTASPVHTQRLAETRDGNERTMEFDLVVTDIGSANGNTARVQLADGATSPFIDLGFPPQFGRARVRVVHRPGVSWDVRSEYFLNNTNSNIALAATSPPTKTEFDNLVNRVNWMKNASQGGSVADPGAFGSTRFLVITTVASSGTPSTMQMLNYRETISGPPMVGI